MEDSRSRKGRNLGGCLKLTILSRLREGVVKHEGKSTRFTESIPQNTEGHSLISEEYSLRIGVKGAIDH